MARTTRSSVAHQDRSTVENGDHSDTASPTKVAKLASKKRKRHSAADTDSPPNVKHPRSDDEDAQVKEEDGSQTQLPPLCGDLTMKEDDARGILDILEMIDTQGLLDRVFPVHDEASGSASSGSLQSVSLRSLLKASQEHPLRILRSAIHQLFPISSLPRSRTSQPAAQQLRFCQLALSLVDEASVNTLDGLSLNPELVIPEKTSDGRTPSRLKPTGEKRRKYALMQTLPTGEWWSSLSSDSPGSDIKSLKDLGTANAELVSILPSVSSSSKPPPTLSDLFFPEKKQTTKLKLPGPRRVSSGHFLDYGPFASFAPSFDSEGADVGKVGLTSVLWRRHEKSKAQEKARRLREKMQNAATVPQVMDVDVQEIVENASPEPTMTERRKEKERQNGDLDDLLTSEESSAVLATLDVLEVEERVEELLDKNAKAILRLEELQKQRLGGEGGGSSAVKEGSEEWDIAQKIMNSLTLLAALRPRLPSTSASALIPPASVLRVLHETLPAQPTQGWYGTLDERRGAALRDDSTVYMTAPVPAPQAPPAAQALPQTAPAAPSNAYSSPQTYTPQNYQYSTYAQQYRAAYPYSAQGQPTAYAPGSYSVSQQNTPTHQMPQYSAQQHAYPSWFPNVQQMSGQGTSTPLRSTPQAQPIATGAAATYAAYSSAMGVASPMPARAVANTITAKSQTNGWSAPISVGGHNAPILPSHVRQTPIASPGTPPTGGYNYSLPQQGFHRTPSTTT